MTGRVVVEADGGSRGNPGPAGYGAVVLDSTTGELLAERSASIGVATNNVAEYSGLIAGLQAAHSLGASAVEVRMDSKLVVEQMCGRWQVKHPAMKPLAAAARELAGQLGEVTFTWIPRLQNSRADKLANLAMDGNPVNRDHTGEPGGGGAAAEPAYVGAPAGPVNAGAPAAPVNAGAPAEAVNADGLAEAATAAAGLRGAAWSAATTVPVTTVLVRHGASVLSPQRRFSGRGDVPLSADGIEQARRVAARLGARGGVAAVVSSPLQRARSTAGEIAGALGLTAATDPDLIETDFGKWEGLTFAEAQQGWPDELAAWLASADVAPPGGESFAATTARVERARQRILAANPGQTVVVVSHVGPVKTLLRIALDAPPHTMFRMQIDVASVSEIDWYADGPASVRLVNDSHHLEP